MNSQREIYFLFGITVLFLCYSYVQRKTRDRFLIKTDYPCSFCVIESSGLNSEKVILSHNADKVPITRNYNGNASVVETSKTGEDTPQPPESLLQKQWKDEDFPGLDVDDRHISVEEILRNASVIRFDYYANLSYPFVMYHKDDRVCSRAIRRIPFTTDIIRKRRYLKVNPKLLIYLILNCRKAMSWSLFMKKKREQSQAPEWLRAKYGWWYGQDVCIENNTNLIHIYTTNYTHYLYLNSTVRSLRIPNDRSNFREVLYVMPHYDPFPSSHRIVDGMYVIMGRGWNNMYHHSEWSIQLIRYVLLSHIFPPVLMINALNVD